MYKAQGGPGCTDWILGNYWLLKSGRLPFSAESSYHSNFKCPFEAAIIWVSDVDLGIDKLGQRRKWLGLCNDENAILENFKYLTFYQRELVGKYIIGYEPFEVPGYNGTDKSVETAVFILTRVINGQPIKKKTPVRS